MVYSLFTPFFLFLILRPKNKTKGESIQIKLYFLPFPVGSLGLVYLRTFTIEINHSSRRYFMQLWIWGNGILPRHREVVEQRRCGPFHQALWDLPRIFISWAGRFSWQESDENVFFWVSKSWWFLQVANNEQHKNILIFFFSFPAFCFFRKKSSATWLEVRV